MFIIAHDLKEQIATVVSMLHMWQET